LPNSQRGAHGVGELPRVIVVKKYPYDARQLWHDWKKNMALIRKKALKQNSLYVLSNF